ALRRAVKLPPLLLSQDGPHHRNEGRGPLVLVLVQPAGLATHNALGDGLSHLQGLLKFLWNFKANRHFFIPRAARPSPDLQTLQSRAHRATTARPGARGCIRARPAFVPPRRSPSARPVRRTPSPDTPLSTRPRPGRASTPLPRPSAV